MLPPDSRQVLKGALCCLLSALLLQVAVGLECYNYTGSFTNEISLGQVPVVTCKPPQNVCTEGVIALSLGDQRMVAVLKKGCHMGGSLDFTTQTYGLNLPSYTHSRFCNTSLCNNLYQNNSHLLAFPTAPPTNSSTSLLCYSCIGTTPESCSPSRAQQSLCYYDSPSCFNGTATATIGGFAVPIYLRSCQAGGCGSLTTEGPWTTLHIETSSCCTRPLCNRELELAPAPTTTTTPSASPSPRLPPLTLLLLLGTLALGG